MKNPSRFRRLGRYLSMRLQPVVAAIRRQPLPSAIIVLFVMTAAAFSQLSSEILEGEGTAIDTRIMLLMRDPADSTNPLGPGWFEEMMRDISGLGSIGILTLLTLAAAVYLKLLGKTRVMWYVLLSIGGGVVFSTLLKAGFDRPRPNLFPHGAQVFDASYPSGHSLLSAVVYLTLGALIAEIQPRHGLKVYTLILASTITLLVGISRIYLGVHWPSDVLAGWLAGSAWAFLCWLISRR